LHLYVILIYQYVDFIQLQMLLLVIPGMPRIIVKTVFNGIILSTIDNLQLGSFRLWQETIA